MRPTTTATPTSGQKLRGIEPRLGRGEEPIVAFIGSNRTPGPARRDPVSLMTGLRPPLQLAGPVPRTERRQVRARLEFPILPDAHTEAPASLAYADLASFAIPSEHVGERCHERRPRASCRLARRGPESGPSSRGNRKVQASPGGCAGIILSMQNGRRLPHGAIPRVLDHVGRLRVLVVDQMGIELVR
jgi:hypothetical protein